MNAQFSTGAIGGIALRAMRVSAAALSLIFFAAGCAEQRIRDQSQMDLSAGEYEKALGGLEEGLRQFPDSTLLRAGQIQARAAAVNRMLSVAELLRAAGSYDEAQRELDRAHTLEPQNRRVASLLAELGTERRQQSALTDAEQWLAKKRPDTALRVVEQALKDNPRHANLLALQRRIEVDQRQAQLRASNTALAETRPITLDFRDANLRTVLDVVSRNSGINFILDKDIRPDTRVTVLMRQARVEDALDLIVSTNQLAKKVVDSQTIVVYPNTPEKQREYQEQIIRVFYLASTEAKGAAAFLKAMLKIRDPFVDERTNMISLRESQENMQLAERLIALYDSADPEVMLEVEVLEINSTRLTELGVKFPDTISLTLLPPSGVTGLTLANIRGLTRDRIGLGVGGLLINLKREVGDFTTLANPKIRARNKEKAKIMIGDKIPIVTSTTGTGGFVSDSVNYLDVGLKLDVEPTVYNDDDVAIKIALEVSTLGAAVKTASGTLAYQIGTRNASTVLRLHDGETQLLAGLISKDDRTNSSRVPGVGDLPVLGRLFSSQVDNTQRTELVLAITPRILRNVRRPDASETELWVGTDSLPRLRPVGGVRGPGGTNPESDSPPPRAPADSAPAAASQPPVQGGPGGPLPIPQAVALSWSGSKEVKVGDTVELKLVLNASVALRGMPTQVTFPKEKLQLLDVVEGDFFRRDGAATSFSKGGDGKDGQIGAGVLRNQGTGALGEGTVLTLKFKAMASGAAEVGLTSAQGIGLAGPAPSPTLPAPFVLQLR
jgi:general secretion pathway protein D